MKNRILYLLVLILSSCCFTQLSAQNTLDNAGLSGSTPSSVAYSLRKLRSNYAGPLVRIVIGTSYYDVYPDTSTNHNFSLSSPISASYANFNDTTSGVTANSLNSIVSGSTSANVVIWYDQSGNGVDVMTSSSTGPIIISSGNLVTMNGSPAIYFAGVNQGTTHLLSSSMVDFTTQTEATINAVVQNVGSTNYISGILSTGNSGGWGLIYDPNNMGYWIDGSGCTNARSNDTENISKIVTGLIDLNASTSTIYENSVLKQTNNSICAIAHTLTDNIGIGIRAANGGDRIFDGYISEVLLFPSQLSDSNRTTLEANQNTAYFSPSISIITNVTNNSTCSGNSVTFTANSYNVTTPTFQWYKNGTAINGAAAATYTTSNLANSDNVYVEMNYAGNSYTSNSITMTVSVVSNSSSAIKLSNGSTLAANLSSQSNWTISGGADQALFSIASNHILNFNSVANYDSNASNSYLVNVTNGCHTMNYTITISPLCGSWEAQGGDGLTQANPGRSAYQIKRDYPNATDGLYWISNPNINNNTPFQIYADMTTNGGGWTLIMCNNDNAGWDGSNAILRNENSPTINGVYSIISYADYLKKSASGFQYMLEATTRGNWGGIWTANQAYSFVHTDINQTDVTLNTRFGNWWDSDDAIEHRLPWYYSSGPGVITTSSDPGNSWWGTLVSVQGFSPAPWLGCCGNTDPQIIWYWVR